MQANLYDAFPYLTLPRRETHPDRLAAVAALFGMTPAPVVRCRVLEIGCGDGGNLLPMAYNLPGSEFLGVDLAGEPIAAAREAAAALGIANATFVAQDLRRIGPEARQFDYILAHGLYSWVPDDVRDALLHVCGERLAPGGVALVSYNAYPGRHIRHMLREMMLYHCGESSGRERVERARRLLEFLAGNRRTSPSWQTMLDDEIRVLLEARETTLLHDDLAPVNRPAYFHEFAAHAAHHGLQYLGDAETRLMFDPSGALDWAGEDIVQREQYLDFLFLRRFRYTLLCHAGEPLDRALDAGRMERLLFSSPARERDGALEGCHGVRIAAAGPAVALAGAMRETYPFPIPFDELSHYAGGREPAREILFALVQGGFAEPHFHDFPCEDSVTPKPRASRLARYQAERGPIVATAAHLPAQLDDDGRRLLALLDGTRTHEAIARDWGAPPASVLEWFAQIGLLEG